ncbi:MAG: KAP family P-loop NTPase fold protein [Candidatus Pacearchaeota archaeon]
MHSFKPDTPIGSSEEDCLQRSEFAKQVAQIANNARNSNALVIGIYGKWGEGKSSVLRLIKSELTENVIPINFNPWYFKDENELLINFFREVSDKLGEKLVSNQKMAIKAIADYGESITSFVSTVTNQPLFKLGGTIAKQIAEKFSSTTLEKQRDQVLKYIIQANASFVVFIDDIDRLNVKEVQTVFRLIKLLADFPRFTYILAFDDEYVARSLGHEFGEGKTTDGYEYLEKIIQVPIRLPTPYKSALRKYTLTHIEKALNHIGIQLSDDEGKRFLDSFDESFMPALKNPRVAVRLSNTIMFSTPLVKGEVNSCDFLILQCIIIFFPELHDFIRDNRDIFLTQYDSPSLRFGTTNSDFKKRGEAKVAAELNKYPEHLVRGIQGLLKTLFPQINSFLNTYGYSEKNIIDWHQEQRICSGAYFDRYFAVAVQDEVISDSYFNNLFSDLTKHSYIHIASRFKTELPKLNLNDFIFKLKMKVNLFTPEESKPLAQALALIGEMIPVELGLVIFQPIRDLSYIIKGLLSNINEIERSHIAEQILEIADTYGFTLELCSTFLWMSKDGTEISLFSAKQKNILVRVVLKKFEQLIKNRQVVGIDEDEVYRTLTLYKFIGEFEYPKKLFTNELQQNNRFSLNILRIFAPTITSSLYEKPYKAAFREGDYEFMNLFVNLDYLQQRTLHGFDFVQIEHSEIKDGSPITDTQLIGLFQDWYMQRKK